MPKREKKDSKIEISRNGPYCVSGLPLNKEIIMTDREGLPLKWAKGKKYSSEKTKGTYYLCRCGHSRHKPFCDGTHSKIGFKGNETASRESYSKRAQKINGPKMILKDAADLCAYAGFCHRKGGVWNLAQGNDKDAKGAIRQSCNCPSGRLVACNKKGVPIEPKFKPSASIIEIPAEKISGPIWVKGNVAIMSSKGFEYQKNQKVFRVLGNADHFQYEKRNRCTLCRCGKSKNKPFCDGSHVSHGFTDGDESLKY